MDLNPYEAPHTEAPAAALDIPASAESIRQAHIAHEASVKSIGILYYLGGIFSIVGGLGFGLPSFGSGVAEMASIGAEVLIILIIAAAQLFIGYGFRRLKSYARILGGIIAAVGLIKFPIGTIISAYVLYLLFSRKGNMVFSPVYKEIIVATPHIRYKSSLLVRICLWVFLGILILIGVSTFWRLMSFGK